MEERKQRGLTQRIYYIGHSISLNFLVFQIAGTTGNTYDVTVDYEDNQVTCTCPDFKRRHMTCKHIYFVLIRIFGTQEETPTTGELVLFVQSANENMDLNFSNPEEKKEGPNQSDKPQVPQRPFNGENCPICLEELTTDEELDFCKLGCGKSLHVFCWSNWLKIKHSNDLKCIYCRANWLSLSLPATKRRKLTSSRLQES